MNKLRLFFHSIKTGLRLIGLMATIIIYAQEDYNAGLRFYNKFDFTTGQEYSSLDISWQDPILIEDELTLSFDFSLRNAKPFGFFFHLKGDSLPHSMLSNIDFKDPDTTYFDFGFRDRGNLISFSIPKTNLSPLKWFHVSITYNFLFDEVRVVLNNEQTGSFKFPMLNEQNIYLQFGYLQTIKDVPSMTVKNIKIHDKNGLKHHWPLNEYEGDTAFDQIGGRIAKATNTQWEYSSHTNWVLHDSLNWGLEEAVITNASAAEIILISNRLRKYEVEEGGHDQMYPDVRVPFTEDYKFYYNPKDEMLFGFQSDKGGYFSINLKNNQLKKYPSIDTQMDHYHTPGEFYDTDTHSLYWVGGYGWYTAKNHIQQYNFLKSKWDTLAVWGDTFTPRFNSAVSKGPNPNSIYIFGGAGNSSGMQERGWQMYYDFWEFNRKTLELKKLFELDNIESYEEVSMGYSAELNQTVIIYKKSLDDFIAILLIDPNSGEVIFHDDIPNTRQRRVITSMQPMVGSETGKLIIASVDQQANIDERKSILIHTINYPPLVPPIPSMWAKWDRWIVGGVALLIALTILMMKFQRNRDQRQSISPIIALPQFSADENPYTRSEFAIQCFGNFKLYNHGEEISLDAWTSKKARSMLVYILLKNKHGVTPHEITNTFWPGSSEHSARNSRYVAMSQIRSIMGDAGTILNIKDHNIYVDIPEGYFSDVHFLHRVIGANSYADLQSRETALRLMGDGQICHDIDAVWMDNIRTDILADGRRIAISLSAQYIELESWKKLSDLGRKMLHWDTIDEDGLLWCIKGLMANGHTAKSKSIFDKYAQNYNHIIDEPFHFTFQDYLNKKI